MSPLRTSLRLLWLRIRRFVFRSKIESELDEEMRFHLEMEELLHTRDGITEKKARRMALLKFGGVDRFKEEARDMRPLAWVDDVSRDVRYSFRALAHNPVFAFVAIATLAVGIGANTAIFSIVHQVLIKPLPYPQSEELVLIWQRTNNSVDRQRVAAPDAHFIRQERNVFQNVAFVNEVVDRTVTFGDMSSHARIGLVTNDLFDALRITPVLGRIFLPNEGMTVSPPANADSAVPAPAPVLLGNEFWRAQFGGDTNILNSTVLIDGSPAYVVGVLPPNTRVMVPRGVGLPSRADLWSPIGQDLDTFRRIDRLRDQDTNNTGAVIGRLRSGVSLGRVQSALDQISERLRQQVPEYRDAGMQLYATPMQEDVVSSVRPALRALFGAVAFVMLIACVNIANLLLARAETRRREMALRTALGAGRVRLIQQVFVESMLLSCIACMVGLVLTGLAMRYITILAPANVPVDMSWVPSPVVLMFTLCLGVASAILFGLVPALRLSQARNVLAMRTRGVGNASSAGLWKSLLIVELALSLLLLVGAGLMMRSFKQLQRVDPGFNSTALLTFRLSYPQTGAGPRERARFLSELRGRITGLPGVAAVGYTGGLPFSGVVWTQPFGLAGQPVDRWSQNEANFRVVSSTYLNALGATLVAGRHFTADEDLVENERVVVVDEQLASRVAPTGSAIGQMIGIPLDGAAVTARIVGVVQSINDETLRDPGRQTIYVPYRQEASHSVGFAVRVNTEPSELVGPIRQVIDGSVLAGAVAGYDFKVMDEYIAESLAPTRLALVLISVFSGVAVLMAVAGVYGVFVYLINHRTHEIGIRIALGAGHRRVVRDMMWNGARLVGIGVGVGWLLALLTSRALSSLVFQVGTADPLTYVAVGGLLAAVSLCACYLPVRRATRISPLSALRSA